MKYRRCVTVGSARKPAVLFFDRFLRFQSGSRNAEKYVEISDASQAVLGLPAASLPGYESPATVSWRGRWYTLRTECLPVEQGGYRVLIGPVSAEEEWRRKVIIYESILNTIHEGVLVTDPSGYVIFYNQELSSLEGISPAEAIGRKVTDLYRQSVGTGEHQLVSQTAKPIPESLQRYFTEQGKEVQSVASTVPVLEQKELLAVYSVCRETTHMKEMLTRTMQLQGVQARTEDPERKKNAGPPAGATYRFTDIIGKSKAIRDVITGAQRAMAASSNIMVYGETGTGKELLVQSIHNGSSRHAQPFVALNCAAVPENLLETMLFGAVKGAYTGAVPTVGLFEYVNEGTLYLDEINSMSIGLQAKLLRALQERSFRRVGSVKEIALRCRIISSINVDPLTCLHRQLLREDLFYRLTVISLYLPPLRERREDIPLLIESFIRKHSPQKSPKRMAPDLEEALVNYRWPGNIRQLENTIESMICMSGDEESLSIDHLPVYLRTQIETGRSGHSGVGHDLPRRLNPSLLTAENSIIVEVLRKHHGNLSRAAKELGILRQSLQYRVKKLGINVEQFRR
ncbi:arginine utilization regulatory protein RocR [Peptococcaceae bacterium CEB3]|nr:arginine utilization regulatory protein RocR [Peptococcaceae bacterium CEB3]